MPLHLELCSCAHAVQRLRSLKHQVRCCAVQRDQCCAQDAQLKPPRSQYRPLTRHSSETVLCKPMHRYLCRDCTAYAQHGTLPGVLAAQRLHSTSTGTAVRTLYKYKRPALHCMYLARTLHLIRWRKDRRGEVEYHG